MPRTRSAGWLPVTQTPALNWFTDGSHTLGATPVRAASPLVSNGIPPSAVVSTPPMTVRVQPLPAEDPRYPPVPSWNRWTVPVTWAQSAYPSAPLEPSLRSCTGGSVAMPVSTPDRYWSYQRLASAQTLFG